MALDGGHLYIHRCYLIVLQGRPHRRHLSVTYLDDGLYLTGGNQLYVRGPAADTAFSTIDDTLAQRRVLTAPKTQRHYKNAVECRVSASPFAGDLGGNFEKREGVVVGAQLQPSFYSLEALLASHALGG